MLWDFWIEQFKQLQVKGFYNSQDIFTYKLYIL